jgi:hypothetical protein
VILDVEQLVSSGSSRIVPSAWLKAISATLIVGAMMLNPASGRRFMITAVSISGPP